MAPDCVVFDGCWSLYSLQWEFLFPRFPIIIYLTRQCKVNNPPLDELVHLKSLLVKYYYYAVFHEFTKTGKVLSGTPDRSG